MSNNYNSVAFFYDALNRVVFGKSTIHAQVWLLQFIPLQARVLIIGGGTGWILEEIASIRPEKLYITYIESSVNMLNKSKHRNTKGNQVEFVHMDALHFVPQNNYDIIITPFLFDNFSTDQTASMIHHYVPFMREGALWLVTDYQISKKGSLWQKALLSIMYTFFRILSKVEVSHMPDIKGSFAAAGFIQSTSKGFYKNFILSEVYKRVN